MELIGKKLLGIRPMIKFDCDRFGFAPYGFEGNVVLMFEGGAHMVASQDFEGNGPGALFYRKGEKVYTLVIQQESVPRRDVLKELEELEKKSHTITKTTKKAKAGKKKAS
jgi:hypothetical protein